jgi:hypothetical protein
MRGDPGKSARDFSAKGSGHELRAIAQRGSSAQASLPRLQLLALIRDGDAEFRRRLRVLRWVRRYALANEIIAKHHQENGGDSDDDQQNNPPPLTACIARSGSSAL